jgi:two-component system, chemotaxis family, CheB/CheR fusion protein
MRPLAALHLADEYTRPKAAMANGPHQSDGRKTLVRVARLVASMRPPSLSPALQIASVAAATALAWSIQILLLPAPAIAPFVFFYFGIALAAWLAGRPAGMATVATSALVANYFFIEPRFQWAVGRQELTATALFVISGSAVALLCGSLRRWMDEALRAERALREADQRKDRFLAMLGHELRNPLAPIRNSVTILRRTQAMDPRTTNSLAVIERQVDHLARLVDDLLNVTRIARGKIQLDKAPIDLCALVERTVDDHRSLASERELQIELRRVDHPVLVHADGARVTQVLGNLLQNAIKFTDPGGRVDVTLETTDTDAIVHVVDTGIGMEASTTASLFEPFAQGDQGMARTRGGLGLGLAVSKALVELHGGELRGTSDGAGKGSAFVLRLPACSGPRHESTVQSAEVPQAQSRRVLIIDDNRDAADSLKDLLELHGNEVIVAYDGPSGLDAARKLVPEVLLCDVGLPGMDGYEVAKRFREDAALQRVLLVALTGYAGPEDRRKAAEAGFAEHVAKPVDRATLQRILERREPPVRPTTPGTRAPPASWESSDPGRQRVG